LLPGHCSGGFSKAGIYPFDKRAISKEKLLQPVATAEVDATITISNTIDNADYVALPTTTVCRLRRLSCPNISSGTIK
jgi:hypothetical protein